MSEYRRGILAAENAECIYNANLFPSCIIGLPEAGIKVGQIADARDISILYIYTLLFMF